MSIKALAWGWKQPLGGNLKLILLALADHADDRGICWPGTLGVAAKCHTDRRTVTRNIRQLERLQLIKVEPRAPGGKQNTNLFTLALDRVLRENEIAEIMSCRDGNLPPLVETPGVATGLSRDDTSATPRDGRNVQVGMAPAPPESSSEPSEQPSRNHHSLSGKPDGVTLLHDAEEILAELNKLAGKHYRAWESGGKPSVNLEFIIGRLKSGATKEQGLQIVRLKVRQWKGNPEKREYLRPATLFKREKFEQYLGEIADREQGNQADVARLRPRIQTPVPAASAIVKQPASDLVGADEHQAFIDSLKAGRPRAAQA